MYLKYGNDHLFLSYTNATEYPMPWTMWGGPFSTPGTYIGNIKFGPKEISCPEESKVTISPPVSFIYA